MVERKDYGSGIKGLNRYKADKNEELLQQLEDMLNSQELDIEDIKDRIIKNELDIKDLKK